MAISFDDIKKWPPKRQAMALGVIYLLIGGAYYSLFLQSTMDLKSDRETKLSEIQEQVQEKERLAAQKGRYVREVKDLTEQFKVALTKLPDQREIPGLLYAVAQAGKDSGVDFVLFEPKQAEKRAPQETPDLGIKPPSAKSAIAAAQGAKPADKKKGESTNPQEDQFYEEIPVRVSVTGGYHSIVTFFEKVARLPRIINIEDISMTEAKDTRRGRLIITNCVIKTYMFLEKMDEKKADGKS
ncbi:MAG TPA: type 4a pilus biogenesis protein PilO [Syntrophales bacterium]|nr:type 4a pilus biogenesis protein PilO [Syntrophales bacterium]